MTTRILPRAEYARLAGTEMETIAPVLPEGARVIVVEDHGVIVATWALYPLVHVEGLWIAPGYRGLASVGRRLVAAMVEQARDMGAEAVQTAAVDPAVAAMAEKWGAAELPGRHFSLRVGKGTAKIGQEPALCQQP